MGSRSVSGVVVAMAMLSACSQDQGGSGHASSTLGVDGDVLFAVNVDEGSVSRIDAKGNVTTADVGREPTRIAVADGRVFVTLRGEGALAILDEDLNPITKSQVGAEPYGVVTTADGSKAYVAVSLQDQVQEVDGNTGKVLRTFQVDHEPRWLALNTPETYLYVASARAGGEIARIDLESGRVTETDPPTTGSQHSPDGTVFEGVPGDLTPRNTGDLVISPDGATLGVPMLYVDNTTPVTDADDPSGGGGGYGGDTGVGVGRINPVLALFSIDGSGDLGEGRAVFLGVAPGRAGNAGGRETFRSYPNAVAADPTGRYFAVSMEGSDAVVVVDSEPYAGQPEGRPARDAQGRFDAFAPPSSLGFWDRPVSMIDTAGSGPRGLAFVGDQLFVHTFLDRRVEALGWSDALAANRHEANDHNGAANPLRIASHAFVPELVASALTPEADRGRRLFLSATNRDMAAKSGGISCGTCHFDGREDSLTWTFKENGHKVHLQTPSLAGPVNDTAPLTWRDPIASVADEALFTTTLRMGGNGPSSGDLDAIQAFVVDSRLPLVPAGDAALVAEGQAIFEREDVQCSTCHAGETKTDGKHYQLRGDLTANTPGLRGVAASAPYLHDGSAKTLTDVLAWTRTGEMGDTSMLSDHEMDALEAYLRSL